MELAAALRQLHTKIGSSSNSLQCEDDVVVTGIGACTLTTTSRLVYYVNLATAQDPEWIIPEDHLCQVLAPVAFPLDFAPAILHRMEDECGPKLGHKLFARMARSFQREGVDISEEDIHAMRDDPRMLGLLETERQHWTKTLTGACRLIMECMAYASSTLQRFQQRSQPSKALQALLPENKVARVVDCILDLLLQHGWQGEGIAHPHAAPACCTVRCVFTAA